MTVQNLISLFGLFAMLFLAWSLSTNRRRIDPRVVIWGTALQFFFALIVFTLPAGKRFFLWLNDVITALLGFTAEGSLFLFGEGYQEHFFAFSVLPTIIFFSSLMAVAYHLGLMQRVVLVFARIMNRFMGTSGAESLSASANIFVGQTEAPLVVRPYVEKMTYSELMAVMTGGMATVAGGVMGAYVGFLRDSFPNIAGHLITASILSAPAALVVAKLMVPETEEPLTRGEVKMDEQASDTNVIEAAAKGAGDGMSLALNVGSMLLAFVALIAMINFCFAWVGDQVQYYVMGIDASAVEAPELAGALAASLESPDQLERYQVNLEGKDARGRTFRFSAPVKDWNRARGTLRLQKRLPPEMAERGVAAGELVKSGAVLARSAEVRGRPGFRASLEALLGILFWPLAFVMGVPAKDCTVIAQLLGEKLILTEFMAYLHLATRLKDGLISDPRSVVIATYALCGFANFASIAIQIGGIAGIAPSRRGDLARLGIRSVIGGTLAAFMTATVAGIFYTGETILFDDAAMKDATSARPVQEETVHFTPAEQARRDLQTRFGI